MTTGQQDAPLWSDKRIGKAAYDEFHLYADHITHDGVQVRLRCTPTIYCADLMRRMRDECEAKLTAERATLTARIAALEAELELSEGMLQQAGQESNMIFDRGAQRLARIKELEAELAQAQVGTWKPLPDGYTHDNPNWALENIRLCRRHPQDDSWQEGSES